MMPNKNKYLAPLFDASEKYEKSFENFAYYDFKKNGNWHVVCKLSFRKNKNGITKEILLSGIGRMKVTKEALDIIKKEHRLCQTP